MVTFYTVVRLVATTDMGNVKFYTNVKSLVFYEEVMNFFGFL